MDVAGRPEPPYDGDELTTLLGFLDFHRATLAMKCSDLSPSQLATRSMPPSTMSLLGLVRHMADVERGWFDVIADRPRRPDVFSTPERPNDDFLAAVGDQTSVDEAFGSWESAIAQSRAVSCELSALHDAKRGSRRSTRWVLTHMIEEYARHVGHADLLREGVDGTVGE